MKSKKRHYHSSEDSEESDKDSKSSSSSSESEDSSASEQRYKKKRKRAESSDSESDSDDQKRLKKRKHKKKKKKHSKKKRRSDSVFTLSDEVPGVSSVSEGEISSKKKRKHKHKHSKRARSSSASEIDESHVQRRLHSVVKERRGSSGERNQPTRTYYQKEYHRSPSVEVYEGEREVQRFYRGSSKEHKLREHHQYEREHNERHQYQTYQNNKFDKPRDRYGQSSQANEHNDNYNKREDFKRNYRYEDQRPPPNEFQKRENPYHHRQDPRGNMRYNQYEDRGPKRREFDDGRDYRERRGPPNNDRYREREYQERREKHPEEHYSSDRVRVDQRDRPPARTDRIPPLMGDIIYKRPDNRDNREERNRENRPDDRDRERRDERNRDMRVERSRDGREERNRDSRDDKNRDTRDDKNRDDREERNKDDRENRDRDDRRERKPERDRVEIKSEPRDRERKSRFAASDEKEYDWGKADVKKEGGKNQGDKEKPNFGLSGKLTADANTVNGVVIKYTEPDDAKQPKRRWRFYPFKGDKALPILYIHRQSAFLIGRDKKVVDISLEHPSISKQHSALQFRATPFTRPDGTQGRRVRPYIIDLDSANGTFVNNKKIEPRRYVELLERDVVKFGFSQREYVLLHENSKDDAQDDDHHDPPELGANVTLTAQIKQDKRFKQEIAEDGD